MMEVAMKAIFRWSERLSLDAVIVAIAWGIVIGRFATISIRFLDLFILGLATWLTYVADRLWEVRPGKMPPETDRHLYYRKNYKIFKLIWIINLIFSIALATVYLPVFKLLWGWGIVASIVFYLWLISRLENPSSKMLLKRTLVPLIFSAGIFLMMEGWRTPMAAIASSMLLSLALSNVLLISYWENSHGNRPKWLMHGTPVSLIILLVCAHVALFFNLPLGLAGLACCGGYFFMFIHIKTASANHVRGWVDVMLAVSAILVVLLTGLPG